MKILLFSPNASIWKSKRIEIALSRALSTLGHEISEIQCKEGLAPTCFAFSEAAIPLDANFSLRKKNVCAICSSRSDLSLKLTKNDLVAKLDWHGVASRISNATELRSLTSMPLEFWPDNLRRSCYELLLESKATDLEFDDEELRILALKLAAFENVYRQVSLAFNQTQAQVIIVTDMLYSANAAAAAAAKDFGARAVTIGSGKQRREDGYSFSLFSDPIAEGLVARSGDWLAVKESPLARSEVRNVWLSIREELRATSALTYSSRFKKSEPSEVLHKLGVRINKRNVLVVTTTNDERFAATVAGQMPRLDGPRNFSSQLDFLSEVLTVAEDLRDVNFIIRLHPRLLPNKRDSKTSQYYQQLMEILATRTSNVWINHPQDNISLADLGLASDMVLNWTSTAGLELASLGVTLLSCEPNETLSYPPEIGLVLRNRTDLKRMIIESGSSGMDVQCAVRAFRFRNFLISHLTLKIDKNVARRTRYSAFSILNFLRLRGRLPSSLGAWDFIDSMNARRFRVEKSDLERLKSFIDEGLHQIKARPTPTRVSSQSELVQIQKLLQKLRTS